MRSDTAAFQGDNASLVSPAPKARDLTVCSVTTRENTTVGRLVLALQTESQEQDSCIRVGQMTTLVCKAPSGENKIKVNESTLESSKLEFLGAMEHPWHGAAPDPEPQPHGTYSGLP